MSAHRGQVLVVDDDPLVGHLVARMIALCGYRTREARGLTAAREALASEAFVAVFCDHALGDGDGLELAQVLVRDRGPPLVLMSGAPDVLATARDRYRLITLDKPMTKDAVRDALRALGLDPD